MAVSDPANADAQNAREIAAAHPIDQLRNPLGRNAVVMTQVSSPLLFKTRTKMRQKGLLLPQEVFETEPVETHLGFVAPRSAGGHEFLINLGRGTPL